MGRVPSSAVEVRIEQSRITASEFFVALLPRGWRADGTVPGLIFCSGYSHGAAALPAWGPGVELARRGYPVISGDCGDTMAAWATHLGPGVWGNDAARTKLGALKTYLQGTLGAKTGKVALGFQSHGAALAYGWARDNPTLVYCVMGGVGTVDVEDIRANNRSSLQASIETAYTNNATWQTARPTHNPTELTATISAIPSWMGYSTDDPICTPTTQTAFASAYGANHTLVSMGAVGHSATLMNTTLLDQCCDFVETNVA